MALMANEIERIYVELVMGVPQSESLVEMGDEAKIVWEKMSGEIAQMREEGKGFEIQHEMPTIDLLSPNRSVRHLDEEQPIDLSKTEEDDESSTDRSVRFSEDQPREPDGKFGSGGGSSKDGDDPTDDELQQMFGSGDDDSAGSEEYANELDNIMGNDQKEFSQGLSESRFEAIKDYTSEGHMDINKALRGAPPPPLTGDALAKNLELGNTINDVILSSPAIEEPVTVFRGVNAKSSEFYDLAVGDVYEDSGVVSTSLSKSMAKGFGGGFVGDEKVLLQIDVKKGSQALSASNFSTHNEYELMLPRNTQFTVTDVRQEGDTRVVVVSAGNG